MISSFRSSLFINNTDFCFVLFIAKLNFSSRNILSIFVLNNPAGVIFPSSLKRGSLSRTTHHIRANIRIHIRVHKHTTGDKKFFCFANDRKIENNLRTNTVKMSFSFAKKSKKKNEERGKEETQWYSAKNRLLYSV